MSVSVQSGYPHLTYSPESVLPARKTGRILQIALLTALGVALLVGTVKRVDPEAGQVNAEQAPLLQGE